MTPDDLTEIVQYWKPSLNLSSWTIATLIEPPPKESATDPDCMMSVHRHHKYNDAILYVQPYCFEDDPGAWPAVLERHLADDHFLEAKIIHELLHLTVRNLVFSFEHTLDGFLHRDVYEQFTRLTDVEEERFVDGLGTSLQEAFGWYRQ